MVQDSDRLEEGTDYGDTTNEDMAKDGVLIRESFELAYNKEDGVADIIIYNRRWIYLGLFFMLNAMMSVVWVEIITVSDQVTILYSASTFKISQLTNIFYIFYVPGSFLSTYMFSRFGLRVTSAMGACLVTISTWLRVVSMNENMYFLQAIASCIAALGQPCIMNGCSLLSAQWFPISERNVSTMIGEAVPAALGGMLVSIFVEFLKTPQDPASDNLGLNSLQFTELRNYFIYVAVVATSVTIIYAVAMRERPPTPPGLAEEKEAVSLLATLAMFKDKNFICLLLIMNADFGMVAILTGLLGDVLSDQNYTQTQDDLLFGGVLAGAILGALVVAPIADHLTKKNPKYYRYILICVNILAAISLLAFILSTKPDNLVPMLLLLSTTSFFWTGGVPVCIEVATEIVYPLPEGAATGYLLMVANLVAFIAILVFYALTNVISSLQGLWFIFAMQLVAILCAFLFNGRYKKREAEVVAIRRATRVSAVERPMFRMSRASADPLQISLLSDNN